MTRDHLSYTAISTTLTDVTPGHNSRTSPDSQVKAAGGNWRRLRDFVRQAGGASRLTQRPLFIVEGHASRNITPRIWLSADAYYDLGGETSIDGARQGNAADTLRLGAGMGTPLWSGGDMVLNAGSVVAKPEGEPDAWSVRLTLRQFW